MKLKQEIQSLQVSYENNTSSFENVRESKQMNATYTTEREIRLVSQYHILLGYGKKTLLLARHCLKYTCTRSTIGDMHRMFVCLRKL